MSAAEKFVREQNLARFLGQLQTEPDPDRRYTLRKLLIEAEDEFGTLSERIDAVDVRIAEGRRRADRQAALVESNRRDGLDAASGERLLANLLDTLDILQSYRSLLQRDMDRNGV